MIINELVYKYLKNGCSEKLTNFAFLVHNWTTLAYAGLQAN